MQGTEQELELKDLLKYANGVARQYGRIGNEDPEDLAQMAMLKVLTKSGQRPANTSWLYKVVRSIAYDACRAWQREAKNLATLQEQYGAQAVCERADQDGYVRLRTTYIPAEEREEDPDVVPRLLEVLKGLPTPFREVLIMHADGMTYREIAEATGVKIGTVRSRLFHARQKAQKLYRID